VNKNIFKMTEAEMSALGVSSLPGNLYEALQTYKGDALVKETLGDHIFNAYYDFKMKEWDNFRTAVHPWEINQYISKY
jgi:glutamine synthetase